MIRLGSDSEFQTAAAFLRRVYLNDRVAALAAAWEQYFESRGQAPEVREPLFRLLFLAHPLPDADVRKVIPEAALGALTSLGVLEREDGRWRTSVLVYPVGDRLVVSDRLPFETGSGDASTLGLEFVYLALTPRTRSFLAMLPSTRCDSALDLGAGSGVAALEFGKSAREVWAADVSERSTLFAAFNARLNGMPNVHAVSGSLYEPVEGRTFDAIVCHPPYDISFDRSLVFADGGSDGEFVLRGAVQGLPRHLRPGGAFYAQAMVGDRTGKSVEQRLREWLGAAHAGYDVAIVVREVTPLEAYAFRSATIEKDAPAMYERHMRNFEQLGVEQLVYCNILVARRADGSAPPLTLRRKLGRQCTAAEFEWLLRSQREVPAMALEGLYPAAAEGLELHTRHTMRGGELVPAEYALHVEAPFAEHVPCPEWVARLVAACSGKHDTNRIFEHLQKQRPVPRAEFDSALRKLIEMGALAPGARKAG